VAQLGFKSMRAKNGETDKTAPGHCGRGFCPISPLIARVTQHSDPVTSQIAT
jgi:hypothetical protein